MLDPQARALLDLIEARGMPSYHTMTPPEARAFYRDRRFFTQPEPPEVAAVSELTAPGPHGPIPIRGYRPQGSTAGQPLPALVYYHGGGWTIGDLDTHDVLCRQIANAAGCAVFSVDYRMGPEHKFPAAVDDSFAALKWVAAQAGSLAIDPQRLAVGGDSAGGNLATVVSLLARDAGGPAIRLQVLIYPATDLHGKTPSYTRNGVGYLLTGEVMAYFNRCYLTGEADKADWRASPLLADDLSRLPPALVLTAGYDPLLDEGDQYAQRLRAAGVPVEYRCFDGQIHGFITMGKVIAQANEAVALCGERLRAAL
ncbi:MAG TPA: alpha/beta hydrolase [Burkholderiaceae bacterium]|nr:alpha/beta hydrolase [Burkholderiaceae bacterium]